MGLAVEIIILSMSMYVISTTGLMITLFMFMKDVKDKRKEDKKRIRQELARFTLTQEKLKEILNRT
jgi:hypothetical protein